VPENIWTWGLASVFSEFLSRSGSAFGPSFGLVLSDDGLPTGKHNPFQSEGSVAGLVAFRAP
jgi:hypothetical protein